MQKRNRELRKIKHDEKRFGASQAGRLYNHKWHKTSRVFRAHNPLCEYAALEDRLAPTQIVDHLYPHGGNVELFWLGIFWVASSKAMHDGFKARVEFDGIEAIDALAEQLGRPPLKQISIPLWQHVRSHLNSRSR